ncbi:WhiB family transcriptional regulator [Streptomyces sp. NPDC056485]|uniref:WhiB family transcriptional regulator n=1 Tax=Streptomyces sp. NPDC056485 TaxID=3345834 RepID=UPI0036BE9FDC
MPRSEALPPMDRPDTAELVVRYRLITRIALLTAADSVANCAGRNPELFSMQASPLRDQPNRAERAALGVCAGCPMQPLCLVQDMRENGTAFEVRGVRAGLRQSERRALHLELTRQGLR